MEPERIEFMYKVRYYDTVRKKWQTSNYRMSEETAAKHFGDTEYEILRYTKEERRIGGDPMCSSTGQFYRGWSCQRK